MEQERKFKTISSIPKDSKEYKLLKNYIDLDNLLFNPNSIIEKDNLYREINLLIDKNKENQEHFFQYLIELLIHFILIRPKQDEIPCFLLSKLITEFDNQKNFIFTIIKKNINEDDNVYLKYFLKLKGIFKDENEPFDYRENKYLNRNEDEELLNILKDDDLNKLKDYFNTKSDIPRKIQHNINKRINKRASMFEQNLIKVCCFYGSKDCFKFLKLNGFEYGKQIGKMGIAGGNLEIIHEIEKDGISFDYCVITGIIFHHKIIIEWLLSNYKCNIHSLYNALYYLDYESFLYFYFNEIDVNFGSMTPLGYLCKQYIVNYGLIQLILDKGADINKINKTKLTSITSLGYLCRNEIINLEVIELLLNRGADVNKECHIEDDMLLINDVITPLGFLCGNKNVNVKSIQLLIDKGADVNKECIDCDEIITPLMYLLKHENINIEAIQLLVDKGCKIDEKILSIVKSKQNPQLSSLFKVMK